MEKSKQRTSDSQFVNLSREVCQRVKIGLLNNGTEREDLINGKIPRVKSYLSFGPNEHAYAQARVIATNYLDLNKL